MEVVAAPAADSATPVTPTGDQTATQAGDPPGADGATRAGSASSSRLRRVVGAVLAVLLVLSCVAIAVLLAKGRELESTLEDRRDVVRVAERFTVQVNNYESDSVDDYKASVGPLLSTKFSAEFDKAMEDIVRSVQEAEMSSEGTVLASGVASLDQDSARVLVVADADVQTVFGPRERHFRWEVSLVRVDGTWLVDDFTPVG